MLFRAGIVGAHGHGGGEVRGSFGGRRLLGCARRDGVEGGAPQGPERGAAVGRVAGDRLMAEASRNAWFLGGAKKAGRSVERKKSEDANNEESKGDGWNAAGRGKRKRSIGAKP